MLHFHRLEQHVFNLFLICTVDLPSQMGARIAQSVEALYFATELHTSSVRVRDQPGTKYLYGKKKNIYVGSLPVLVVSQAYPGNAEICPGFPPPSSAHNIQQ